MQPAPQAISSPASASDAALIKDDLISLCFMDVANCTYQFVILKRHVLVFSRVMVKKDHGAT